MILGPVQLLKKYRSRGLLLDSNLLLLFVAGRGEPRLIGSGRLNNHSSDHYELLEKLRVYFGNRMATTPHVLTEVSNLLNDMAKGHWKERCFKAYETVISHDLTEILEPSKDAAARAEFVFLGLTDCALAQAADRYVVLSSDATMVVKLHETGLNALNFCISLKTYRNWFEGLQAVTREVFGYRSR